MITQFQQRYMGRWEESSLCEEIALRFLRLNFGLGEGDILRTGKGVMSKDLLDDPLESPPDFYAPKLGLWFEVTSSSLTKEESMRRCSRHGLNQPHIFVREGKVESLRLSRALSKAYFVSVNWADGSDDYITILYQDMPIDMGKTESGKFQYSITDVEGDTWLLLLDHPLEEVIPRFEDTPVGATISPILTRFMTGVLLSEGEEKLEPKRTWKDVILRRKPELASTKVRTVYCYATPAKVKKEGPAPKIEMPSEGICKALYGSWISYTISNLMTELKGCKDNLEKLKAMAEDNSAIKLKIGHVQLEEERYEFPWKWVIVVVVVGVIAFFVLKYFGVIL